MLQSNIESFKQYSTFKSLQDFNNNSEAFLATHKNDFTRSELLCYKVLTRFSVKVLGVSNISINKLLQAISSQFKGVSISESTFHRFRRKAVKLGILKVISTVRKNGSQSSNLWVFNRFLNVQDVQASASNDTPIKSETLSNQQLEVRTLTPQLNYQSLKTSNILNKRIKTLDSQFTSNRVPKEFTSLTSLFYDSASTIEELWKIVTVSTYHTQYDAQTVLNLALESFRQLVRLVKKQSIRKSIYAVYWGIVNRKLDQLYFEGLYDEGFAV